MADFPIIYFRGDEWYLSTDNHGSRWLHLALDNGSKQTLIIPEETALRIMEGFLRLEDVRHQAELRRLQGME